MQQKTEADDSPETSPAAAGRSPTMKRRRSCSKSTAKSEDTPKSSTTPKSSAPTAETSTVSREERRRAEIFQKFDRIEEQRARDQKVIGERVDRGKDARDDRFDRLVEAVTGRDNLAYKTAMALRERENHEDKRRQEFHEAWDQNVYKPLVDQAYAHMNPPDRVRVQRLVGSKGVDFSLPTDSRRLLANVSMDPVRKPSVDHAQENAFHHVASVVLQGTQSAPHLHNHCMPPPATGGHVMPRARTRPVLEPTNWGAHEIKGKVFGHFAQICEFGPGFKRAMRGGTNAHIPDVSDMVLTAGSRKAAMFGHGDVGVLRGDIAALGEANYFKAQHGPSCGAPVQDHFTFESGPRITNLEFPPGKRIFPEFC